MIIVRRRTEGTQMENKIYKLIAPVTYNGDSDFFLNDTFILDVDKALAVEMIAMIEHFAGEKLRAPCLTLCAYEETRGKFIGFHELDLDNNNEFEEVGGRFCLLPDAFPPPADLQGLELERMTLEVTADGIVWRAVERTNGYELATIPIPESFWRMVAEGAEIPETLYYPAERAEVEMA